MLIVPYTKQISENSCGIACFEMVYRYFKPSKLSKFSQTKVFARFEVPTDDKLASKVDGASIIKLAIERGFSANWGRLNPIPERLLEQIEFFTETAKVPPIVCQQWQGNTARGHYRVIIGVSGRNIVFHDPEDGRGGASMSLPVEAFIEQCKPVLPDVTGGALIWFAQTDLVTPLDPKDSRHWF